MFVISTPMAFIAPMAPMAPTPELVLNVCLLISVTPIRFGGTATVLIVFMPITLIVFYFTISTFILLL